MFVGIKMVLFDIVICYIDDLMTILGVVGAERTPHGFWNVQAKFLRKTCQSQLSSSTVRGTGTSTSIAGLYDSMNRTRIDVMSDMLQCVHNITEFFSKKKFNLFDTNKGNP